MLINDAIFRLRETTGVQYTTGIVRKIPTNEQEYKDPTFISWTKGVNEINSVIEGTWDEVLAPEWELLKQTCDQMRAEQEYYSYIRKRQQEYPPAGDFLDASIKGDQAAIDAYTEKCLAVKAKYPKPDTKPDHMNDPDYPGLPYWLLP